MAPLFFCRAKFGRRGDSLARVGRPGITIQTPKGFHRRGAEGDEGDEENREEQKENLTQGQKSSSILITSHESQITVEQSETQHKGTEAQSTQRKKAASTP